MLNLFFIILVIVGIIGGICLNNGSLINEAILESPMKSLKMFINIGSSLIFFSGIMEICKDAGLLKFFTKIFRFLLNPLFPDTDFKTMDYISGNIAANMLGLGSCATPLGIKAMEGLKEGDRATKKMITLLILNTSGLTLIPETILSLRVMYNAQITSEIIPYIAISSILTSLIAISLDYIFRKCVNE